jgi:hypothetical protein
MALEGGSLMKSVLVLVLLAVASPAFAGLVTNGAFDGGSCAGWTASPTPFNTSGYNECRATGGNPGGFAVLNDVPAVAVTMSQSLAGLVVGDQYQLTWDMESAYQGYGSYVVPGAGAKIDGNTWEFAIGNSPWASFSETFTYTGVSNVLTFVAQDNGTDTDAGFDNIVLTDLSAGGNVPEPATFALLGAGLIALGVIRRVRGH